MTPGSGRPRRTGSSCLPLACALLLATPTPALAQWPAETATGSATSVQAAAVPSVGTVTAVRGSLGLELTVTWSPVTVEGVAVSGYEVLRYRTVGGVRTLNTTAGGCTGQLLTTTCSDTGSLLGLAGALSYVVTPIFSATWRGPSTTSNTA